MNRFRPRVRLMDFSLRAIAVGVAGFAVGLIGVPQPLAAEPTSPSPSAGSPPTLTADAVLDIVDTAEQYSLDAFIDLLTELGMVEDLRGYGRFTVFAPSDEAFAAFLIDYPQFQGELTPELRDQLATVLAYHVIAMADPITTDNFIDLFGGRSTAQRTLARPDVILRLRRGDIYVNGVEAIEPDIEATNGVIHVIDQILIPPVEPSPRRSLQKSAPHPLED